MSEAASVAEHLSPGQALAAARAEQKLSVADVSQQIKYGVKQIAAIEADDYARLPGATFVRGMIRSYAKLLHIDPQPLLADLGRREIPGSSTVDLRTDGQEPFIEGGEKSNRIYVLLSIAALVAVAIVVYEWRFSPLDTGQVVTITSKPAAGDAGSAAPAAAPAPAPAAAPAAVAAAAPAPLPEPTAAAASVPADPPPRAQSKAAPRTPPAPAASAVSAGDAAGANKRIELAFDQLSWVEVKQADGKVLLSQLNQPGSRQVIDGVPPFQIVIGNAANVRLKYDDAPVDLRPYFKVDVARLKLE
jgi:cytoskeleton protein RodZ